MIDVIFGILFFAGAVWFVAQMAIDEYSSYKIKTEELAKLNEAVESYRKIEGDYRTMDKCTKEISVYTVNEIRGLHSLEPISPPKKEEHLYNCPNCGAPITGDHCEYCGTMFRDREEDVEILYADNRPILTLYNRMSAEKINANLINRTNRN